MNIDTIITGGTILTMNPAFEVLEEHAILISSGKITDIIPAIQAQNIPADKTIDAKNCLITPGFINTHSHLPMTYLRGLADDLPLQRWLGEYIWPMEAKLANASFVYDASLHGAAEMIRNGITMTNDMYFHSDETAKALSKAGMRALISKLIINPEGETIDEEIRFLEQMRELYDKDGTITWAIAPHAIYTCSDKIFSTCFDYAKESGTILHTHLSETKQEVDDCRKAHGLSPLFYLKKLGFEKAKCIFAHGVWLSEEEIELLSDTPSAVSICTQSNLKLTSGIAPLMTLSQKGANFAFGTDGVASNNDLDILSEASFTSQLHKTINNKPQFMPAKETLARLTIHGAKALGTDEITGSLEIGKRADLLLINHRNLQSANMYDPYSHLIYAIGKEQISHVMVEGRLLMEQGKLSTLDEEAIIDRAEEYKTMILREIRDVNQK